MAIGTLLAKIVLDNPRKVHYGSEDPVTGNIVLSFAPSTKVRTESNPELFGPLQLAVTFHGRVKSKIWKKQGNNTAIYRGRANLFNRSKRIYDDSFRARPNQSHSFPFELYFPEAADSKDYATWERDLRFEYKPGDPLPPSFDDAYRGFAHHYEAFVEYRVGVTVAMPRLQIIIAKPDKEEEPLILYERPRLLTPVTSNALPWKGNEYVKNELLLPEADRPTGFRQKAKAAFSSDSYPMYSFDWQCFAPRHIHIGQPIVFQVSIRPREKECTAVLVPEVVLDAFTVEIKAVIEVRAEKGLFTSPESSSDETKMNLRGVIDDKGPFSKANDWSKTVNTREVRGINSTFQTYNISSKYRMKVKGAFTVAGKVKDFSQSCLITVYPPLLTADSVAGPSSSAMPGSSSQPLRMGNMEASLPQYERPPEYEEASAEAPPPPIKDGKDRAAFGEETA